MTGEHNFVSITILEQKKKRRRRNSNPSLNLKLISLRQLLKGFFSLFFYFLFLNLRLLLRVFCFFFFHPTGKKKTQCLQPKNYEKKRKKTKNPLPQHEFRFIFFQSTFLANQHNKWTNNHLVLSITKTFINIESFGETFQGTLIIL